MSDMVSATRRYRIASVPGDGIGPEVIADLAKNFVLGAEKALPRRDGESAVGHGVNCSARPTWCRIGWGPCGTSVPGT